MRHFRTINIALMFGLLLLIVTSAQAQIAAACADSQYAGSRLVGGVYARALPGTANNVRESASTSANIIAQIEPGQVVYVTSAPVCAEGYVWWQVVYREPQSTEDFPFGYTAEGAAPLGEGSYWLEPAPQAISGIPQQRQPITATNISQLQQVAQVEFGMVNRFAWSGDSSHLAINTVGAAWVYDLTVAESLPVRITPYSYDTNYIQSITLGEDGDAVAVAGSAYSIPNAPMAGAAYLWSLATPDQPQVSFVESTNNFGGAAAISPDGFRAAFADANGTIRIVEIGSGRVLATLEGHIFVGGLAFTVDGTQLVSIGGIGMMISDSTARLWDAANGAQIGLLEIGDLYPPLALSPDGKRIAIGRYNSATTTQGIQLINLKNFTEAEFIEVPLGGVIGVTFGVDSSLLAYSQSYFDDTQGAWASAVHLYDLASGTELSSLPINAGVGTLSFSPDGTLLAFAYEDPQFWGPNRATLWAVP
jgi:WD40 repeat protein